jgi:ATP-dependent RNA helicase HelY
MLPAITFIFSRAGCDEAVAACLDSGLRLTTVEERARIRAIVDETTAALSDSDLDVLKFDRWLAGLEAGLAAHHAGMVPPFKETVEACFTEGLIKAVFATETLALGINMPARSVVIERLSKFTGERREFLTPGEYTQLTGRAGRRGIDEIGYAIVLWSPFVPFDQVASLASSRTYALRSAFRPTFNMAANLVRRYEPAQAHHLLNLSFAQYQADGAVVRLEARLERQQARLARLREESRCSRGEIEEYRELRAAADVARRSQPSPKRSVEDALARLVPGDVISHRGKLVGVISISQRTGGATRVRGITTAQSLVLLDASDFDDAPTPIAQIELPVPYTPNNHKFEHGVAQALLHLRIDPVPHGRLRERPDERAGAFLAAEAHPVSDCPDRDAHVRAAAQADRVERELADLRRQVRSHTESLARRFDRVLRLLEAWGYLDGWSLTERGVVLSRTYHECDLLIAEAMTTGVLDGLAPPELAALVSCFTYEHRGPTTPPAPRFPSTTVRTRFAELERLADELNTDEESAGLPRTKAPDAGFADLAHGWAAGEHLADVLEDEVLSGGDFVRNIKQLIDLLRQVGEVAPNPDARAAGRSAADALYRDVVAASSAIEVPEIGEAVGDDPQG